MGEPRRDRPGVPGQLHRRALHAPHQRLHQRHRQQGAAVPPLVRPRRRLPHLLHRLDSPAHPRAGRRHADPGAEEPRGQGRGVPVVAADAAVREPVERRGLGDAGRPRQDGLVAGALRRAVPQLHRHHLVAGRRRRVLRPGDGRDGAAGHEVGAGHAHGVQLLRGQRAVPLRLAARVLHAVEIW
uniref:Uncharacterized protein n=1 Tax=Triticum urartu TaxID=4572 RepID=A0A8R7PIQ0_TRIUA